RLHAPHRRHDRGVLVPLGGAGAGEVGGRLPQLRGGGPVLRPGRQGAAMNLLNARVVLRPRSLADVLDLTVPFCLSNWRLIWRLGVTALLPVFALCLYVRLGRHWTWTQTWLLAVLAGDFLEGLFTLAYGDL